VRNRIEAGGANCPSVSSGLAVSGETEIDGFFGGSTTVCSRGSLRARLFFFFDVLLASVFNGFPGGITGVAVGKSSGNTPRPSGSFSDSTHRRMVSFSSSIAAHPARPKLAETVIETSATRVRARIDLAIVRVAGSLVGVWGGREGGTVWLPRG